MLLYHSKQFVKRVLEIFGSHRIMCFPYDEILKIFKSKTWRNEHPKIFLNIVFQLNQSRGLGVTSSQNLGPYN